MTANGTNPDRLFDPPGRDAAMVRQSRHSEGCPARGGGAELIDSLLEPQMAAQEHEFVSYANSDRTESN